MVNDTANLLSERGVRCSYRTSITEGSQILAGIKTKAGSIPERSTLQPRRDAVPLRRIFNNEDVLPTRIIQ